MSIHHRTALNKDSRYSFINSSNTNTGTESISIGILIKNHDIGFKIIPICNDSKTPAVKSTNAIYDNPEYWTTEILKQEYCKFVNLATTFGKTYVKDEGDRDLYLNGLDIDSDKVLGILFDLLDELKYKTFVTKTKKDSGYHVYWLSHKQIRVPFCDIIKVYILGFQKEQT